MARIRTIKPEFPHSESMGRISRDSRLAFVMLWTIADDSGRLRGNSRMLASLLFPYDDDAPALMDSWLKELEGERCIQRYQVEGQSYVQVCNWLMHQKIDKPSPSKIPEFAKPREDSRKVAKAPRRKGREGKGEDQEGNGSGSGEDQVTPATAVATIPEDLTPEQQTWDCYLQAYAERYKTEPVSNAKVRSQITAFCKRVPQEEAPHIAAFYVRSNKAFYIQAGHAIGPLLQDAEAMRTQWATGRTVTNTEALQADKTQARGNVWNELIQEAKNAEIA